MIKTTIKPASLRIFVATGLLLVALGDAQAGVVVIGHANLGKLDSRTMQRIYTGKVVEVDGVNIIAVNIESGPLRERFLHDFLNQSGEKYKAYWTVRRYIGKGLPPRELPSAEEVVRFVQSTPGAIGYIDEGDVTPGLNVIAR